MALDVYFKSQRGFLDEQGRVLWPPLVQAVKHLIKHQDFPDATRSAIKGWLKSSDAAVALMSLTVIETIAMNSPVRIRQQIAGPRWMERFSKQLAKPQSHVVLCALLHMLVDFSYLFNNEELGIASQALLSQPSSSWAWMLEGMQASQEAQDVKSDWLLGVPPVGPHKGPDYTLLLRQPSLGRTSNNASHRGVGVQGASSNQPAPVSVSGPSVSSVVSGASGNSGLIPETVLQSVSATDFRPGLAAAAARAPSGAAQDAHTAKQSSRGAGGTDNQKVTVMLSQMANHAHELRQLCSVARATAASIGRSGTPVVLQYSSSAACAHGGQLVPTLPPALAGHVDKGYQAAERCASWRSRISELCQTLTDPAAISQLLSALDVINAALGDWQRYASGGELFAAAGLTGDLAAPWRSAATAPAAAAAAGQPPLLLDLAESPTAQQTPLAVPPGGTAHGAGWMEELSASLVATWPGASATPTGAAAAAATAGGNPFAVLHNGTSGRDLASAAGAPPQPASSALQQGPGQAPAAQPPLPSAPAFSASGAAGAPPPTLTNSSSHPQLWNARHAGGPHPALQQPHSASSRYPRTQHTGASTGGADTASPQGQPSPRADLIGSAATSVSVSVSAGGAAPPAQKQASLDASLVSSAGSGAMPSAWAKPGGVRYLRNSNSTNSSRDGLPLQTTPVPAPGASAQDAAGTPSDGGTPDWQAKLSTILADTPARQVGLKLEGQLRALLASMHAHYEEQLASTKEKAVTVVRQLKQELQQQQQLLHRTADKPVSSSAASAAASASGHEWPTWHGGEANGTSSSRGAAPGAGAGAAAGPRAPTEWHTWHGGQATPSQPPASTAPSSTARAAPSSRPHAFDPFAAAPMPSGQPRGAHGSFDPFAAAAAPPAGRTPSNSGAASTPRPVDDAYPYLPPSTSHTLQPPQLPPGGRSSTGGAGAGYPQVSPAVASHFGSRQVAAPPPMPALQPSQVPVAAGSHSQRQMPHQHLQQPLPYGGARAQQPHVPYAGTHSAAWAAPYGAPPPAIQVRGGHVDLI